VLELRRRHRHVGQHADELHILHPVSSRLPFPSCQLLGKLFCGIVFIVLLAGSLFFLLRFPPCHSVFDSVILPVIYCPVAGKLGLSLKLLDLAMA